MDDSDSNPWHQRFVLVRKPRKWARNTFFNIARAAARTDDGRSIVRDTLDDLVSWRPVNLPPGALHHEVPYTDLGRARPDRRFAERRPVFITARFRSGSTLLWRLFRSSDACTAYYEPFNERRWFDAARRGTRLDWTHRHVDDYWREYDGLGDLGQYYDEDWTRRNLYMDETAWNPAMAAYVRLMVERAPRRPVLQFNRIDFRLPWFRRTFPAATIVHLFRHPRDQWCSSLGDSASCSTSCTIADFRSRDGFYLLSWAADLKYRFPFLDVSDSDHPYRLFYFIWKLSYLFGIAYADYSISFESLVTNPETESKRLFTSADLDCADLDRIARLVEPTPNRWRQYGSDAWFRGHEELCEQVLHDFFGASELREGPPIPHTAVRGAGVEELVGR